MNNAPILVLQMQRMGDLILSFPLLAHLGAHFPDHPLWVIGEERFFTPLLPLSPNATYFAYEAAEGVLENTFHAVINISHRKEAAAIAGKARTDAVFGTRLSPDGSLFINGGWQVYRASLTHNNRYNRFHWSDLNIFDLVAPGEQARTVWPAPRAAQAITDAGKGARIGLFVGASENAKRPDPPFWAELARLLMKAGHRPVFMGGEAERELAAAAADALGAPPLNLAGRFSVSALTRFLSELDLFITPDTGPMHLAAWNKTPVLNLSVGPVNPWETGPVPPGQHVLRPMTDCCGCWTCPEESPPCLPLLSAQEVARLAGWLLTPAEEQKNSGGPRVSKHSAFFTTSRDAFGLYSLNNAGRTPETDGHFFHTGLATGGPQEARHCGQPAFSSGLQPAGLQGATQGTAAESVAEYHALAHFWQGWFASYFSLLPESEGPARWRAFAEAFPARALALKKESAFFAAHLAKHYAACPEAFANTSEGWQMASPGLRPLTGYLHMDMQNASADKASFVNALRQLERFAEL